MAINDQRLAAAMLVSPEVFVKNVFGLVPERDNSKFVLGKHISWHQHDILLAVEKAMLKQGPKKISVRSGNGCGKAQPESLFMDTPAGEKKFGELKVGDFVFGINGKPVKVIGIFPQGELKIYKVTFNDGSSTLASGEHLWKVHRFIRKDLNQEWKIKSTEELLEDGIIRKRKDRQSDLKLWKIPVHGAVEYPFKWVPADPYTVGAWIGDGCRNTALITGADNEVFETIQKAGYKINVRRYFGKASVLSVSNLKISLEKLHLLDKNSYARFIPDEYKYNSVEVREDLLRGLLDTDGYVNVNGGIQYTTTSKILIEDIIWLVRSLGGKAKEWKPKNASYVNDGRRIACRTAYTANLIMPDAFRCFNIKRKQDRVRAFSQKRYLERWIASIEEAGTEKCVCIRVDNEDGLYLTNDFIVTHNSSSLAFIILWYLFVFKDSQVACTAPSSTQIFDVLWKECNKWISKMPPAIREKYDWNTTHIRMKENPYAWFARAATGKKESPEALAGLHSPSGVLLAVDEASGVADEIFEIAEGSLTEANNLVILISNPTRLTGYFYETFNKDKARWQNLNFNTLDSPLKTSGDFALGYEAKYGISSDEYRIHVLGEFPEADSVDKAGYIAMFNEGDLAYAQDTGRFINPKLGVDPAAEGFNEAIWVVRDKFKAKIVAREQSSTPRSMAIKTSTIMEHYNIAANRVIVDDFGPGAKLIQELAESGVGRVRGVNVGERPDDRDRFLNRRAENYMRLKNWLHQGGQLVKDEAWRELLDIKYRRELSGKIKVKGKREMRAEGIDSPNCFIAGTKIKTPAGEKSIEDFKKGDRVFTPLGIGNVLKKWEMETDELCEVKFSNKNFLIGTKEHKIFTEHGFVSLDSLVLTDTIEVWDQISRFIWKIKKLLFFKDRNIGFYQAENIIAEASLKGQKGFINYYIMMFGNLIRENRFLKDASYIIKTVMFIIIRMRIWNLCCLQLMRAVIQPNDFEMKVIKKRSLTCSQLFAPYLPNGMLAEKGIYGIRYTENKHGSEEKPAGNNVFFAKKILRPFLIGLGFVQESALLILNTAVESIKPIKGLAWNVKRYLWRIGIGRTNIVVESVRIYSVPKTKVYNLTLDIDNVYYANGILAKNCADATMLTFDTAEIFSAGQQGGSVDNLSDYEAAALTGIYK